MDLLFRELKGYPLMANPVYLLMCFLSLIIYFSLRCSLSFSFADGSYTLLIN